MPKSSLRVMTLCGALTLSAGAYAAMTYATPLLSNEPSVTRAVAAADAVVFSGERGVARSEDGAEYRRQGTYVGDGFRTFQHVHYQRFHEACASSAAAPPSPPTNTARSPTSTPAVPKAA